MPKFSRGLAITVAGTADCETGEDDIPDPNAPPQMLLGLARLVPSTFTTTRVVVGSGRAGVRWAWLDPLEPPASCAGLALPRRAATVVPHDLVSRWVPARELARHQFNVLVAGSREWTAKNADGNANYYSATWSFQLSYVRGSNAR